MWHGAGSVVFVVVLACSPAAALGQAETAEPPRWGLDLEQGRLSSVLNGDALDDPRLFGQTDTDDVRSWARHRLRLSRETAAPEAGGASWAASVVQEVHILGTGARAGARLNQDQGSGVGQRYPFDVQSTRHRRWQVSARLHRTVHTAWPTAGPVHGQVGLNLMVVDRYKAIGAHGVLQDMAHGDIGLQARSTRGELGGTSTYLQPDKPLGWGLSLSLGFEGGQPGQGQWRLAVRDLGPKVRLRHVLQEDKTADTNTLSYDEQGFVNFAPVVRGRYSDREAYLRIEPEWSAHYTHPLHRNGQIEVGAVWHGARQEVSLGYQYQWGSQRLTVTGHALRDMPSSIGLRWDMPFGSLGWRADRFGAGMARIWMLEGAVVF